MHHDQWCNLEKMATELSCLGGEYRQIYEQSSLRENDSHSYSPFQVRGIRFIYIYKNNPSQLRNSVTLLDQPQSFSRSWAVGCSRSAMKSALIQGSSNHLSQDSPTGVIIRGTTRSPVPSMPYQSPPQQDQVSDVGGQRLCALLQGAGRGEIQVAIVCR